MQDLFVMTPVDAGIIKQREGNFHGLSPILFEASLPVPLA